MNNKDTKILRCKECGDAACICSSGTYDNNIKWAAHCVACDNTIGKRGYYDPCAESQKEAIKLWNELNRE